jgi:hypothetical protein
MHTTNESWQQRENLKCRPGYTWLVIRITHVPWDWWKGGTYWVYLQCIVLPIYLAIYELVYFERSLCHLKPLTRPCDSSMHRSLRYLSADSHLITGLPLAVRTSNISATFWTSIIWLLHDVGRNLQTHQHKHTQNQQKKWFAEWNLQHNKTRQIHF